MNLQTNQLTLIPLNHRQLINYLQLDYSLEKELNLAFVKRTIAAPLAEAFQNRILPNIIDPTKMHLLFTLWIITYKNVMVGELCFKGEPNENGEIEIGYGTYNAFQNYGYMTEALNTISKWAFKQPAVQIIIAKTNLDNIASQKILLKNNFLKIKEAEMIEWQLHKPD